MVILIPILMPVLSFLVFFVLARSDWVDVVKVLLGTDPRAVRALDDSTGVTPRLVLLRAHDTVRCRLRE